MFEFSIFNHKKCLREREELPAACLSFTFSDMSLCLSSGCNGRKWSHMLKLLRGNFQLLGEDVRVCLVCLGFLPNFLCPEHHDKEVCHKYLDQMQQLPAFDARKTGIYFYVGLWLQMRHSKSKLQGKIMSLTAKQSQVQIFFSFLVKLAIYPLVVIKMSMRLLLLFLIKLLIGIQ